MARPAFPPSTNFFASESPNISALLGEWAAQDPTARDRLVPIVYEELRRLAHHYMRGERAGHTLQTPPLVNIEVTAEALEISPANVKREWTSAKAWLRQQVCG